MKDGKIDDDVPLRIPRGRVFDTFPRRSLWKAVLLLAMLMGILMIRRRAATIADTFARVLYPSSQAARPGIRATVAVPDAGARAR